MEIPKALLDRLKANEETARKFNEIEISILSVLDFNDFFDRLLSEISDKFAIPHIWIAMISDGRLARQLTNDNESCRLTASTVYISREKFSSIVKTSQPILANSELSLYRDIVPPTLNENFHSIAIAPISLDGELVGSINQADRDPKRFQPGIDTSLLEQLALKVSICLSNVAAHEQLKFLAFHDPLTGLLNRGVMERILGREYSRAKRYQNELSLIFVDLDDFKTINDTAGHDAGDRALCRVARVLTAHKRDSDIVSRFAGDEFVIILPSTSTSQAEYYIQRVKQSLDTAPLECDAAHYIHLSYGIASIHETCNTRELIKIADKRLYQSKAMKNTQNRRADGAQAK